MRVTDLFLALPSTLVAIAIVAALGPGLTNTLIGISVVWWPYYARIIRVRGPRHRHAARTSRRPGSPVSAAPGSSSGTSLPGVVPTAIVTASLDIGNVVLLLAGLSFLGLGQPAPAAELGADTAAQHCSCCSAPGGSRSCRGSPCSSSASCPTSPATASAP